LAKGADHGAFVIIPSVPGFFEPGGKRGGWGWIGIRPSIMTFCGYGRAGMGNGDFYCLWNMMEFPQLIPRMSFESQN